MTTYPARRHLCEPCQVLWTDTDPNCWVCGKPGTLRDWKGAPGAHTHNPDATEAMVAGQPVPI